MNGWSKAAALTEAEQALKAWGVKYKKKRDGRLLVPGDLDISSIGLTKLPDLSAVSVGGYFRCGNNRLTSLAGAPQDVRGGFGCQSNLLTSLEGAPLTVTCGFWCQDNLLTSLEGAPRSLGGGCFFCGDNQLTSLAYLPVDFKDLYSDLGKFKTWHEVPHHLRVAPLEAPMPKHRRGFNL